MMRIRKRGLVLNGRKFDRLREHFQIRIEFLTTKF
jgi:hypothetical protein